ncbi:hypothetical protein WOLCODRAFT_109738, partial [Wolfiporia cocos MD-104 SS10]
MWAVVSYLRVYVISERNACLSMLVLTLALVPCGVNLFVVAHASYYITQTSIEKICVIDYALTAEELDRAIIVSRASLITSDAIVLIVTWLYTYEIRNRPNRTSVQVSLARMLAQNGLLYFLILLLLNLTHILLYCIAGSEVDQLSSFIPPISSIIISRFLLGIRQVRFMARAHTGIPHSSSSASISRARGSLPRRLSVMVFRVDSPCETE